MGMLEKRSDYLLRGQNGLETCLTLSEDYAEMFAKRKYMERDKVKEILRRLNEAQVRYAIIGGMALAHHAVPRFTQDLDLMVLAEDAPRVHEMFSDHYQRGTAVARIYDFNGTRFDIQPTSLRVKRAVIDHAIDDTIDDVPVKVAGLRDLILLKLLAVPERPELPKRLQDEADVAALLQHNAERITSEDVQYIGRNLLAVCFTGDEVKKYRQVIVWLNETLSALGMADRRYPLDP